MGPLNVQEQRFVKVRELLKLHKHAVRLDWKGNGRPPNSHLFIAHSFVAKATWNMSTTNGTAIEARERVELSAEPTPAAQQGPRNGEVVPPSSIGTPGVCWIARIIPISDSWR
jgi:hypothetical protein